jgi:hypothetical protein
MGYIQQGVIQENGQHIPWHHLGSLLVPEGQLPGQKCMLGNLGLYLLGTQHDPSLAVPTSPNKASPPQYCGSIFP